MQETEIAPGDDTVNLAIELVTCVDRRVDYCIKDARRRIVTDRLDLHRASDMVYFLLSVARSRSASNDTIVQLRRLLSLAHASRPPSGQPI